MWGMVIDMDEAKLQTVAQVKTFLEGTHDIALKVPKTEQYGFIERVLKRLGYGTLPRCDKSVVRYLDRMTGLSRPLLPQNLIHPTSVLLPVITHSHDNIPPCNFQVQ